MGQDGGNGDACPPVPADGLTCMGGDGASAAAVGEGCPDSIDDAGDGGTAGEVTKVGQAVCSSLLDGRFHNDTVDSLELQSFFVIGLFCKKFRSKDSAVFVRSNQSFILLIQWFNCFGCSLFEVTDFLPSSGATAGLFSGNSVQTQI